MKACRTKNVVSLTWAEVGGGSSQEGRGIGGNVEGAHIFRKV